MSERILKLGAVRWIIRKWKGFEQKYPGIAEFTMFFILSNGITVLQMILMPVFKAIFNLTPLVDIDFRVGRIGTNFDGSDYYMFDYKAGLISAGGSGGLAYFLAIQVTLAIAQVVNFFGQRNVTFKAKEGNIWKHARWYLLAYIVISVIAAALQGLYKAPVYNLFMNTWAMGSRGEVLADFVTMIITCAVSFWVYYPILKIIFKQR